MSTSAPDINNVLTGDFLELYIVDNLGTTSETETPIGYTYDGIELSQDPTEVSFDPHSSRFTQRKRTNTQLEFTFTQFYVAGLAEWDAMGLINANGEFQFGTNQQEAVRVYVYDAAPEELTDTTAARDTLLLPDFGPQWDSLTMDEGTEGAIEFTAFVNDRPVLESH